MMQSWIDVVSIRMGAQPPDTRLGILEGTRIGRRRDDTNLSNSNNVATLGITQIPHRICIRGAEATTCSDVEHWTRTIIPALGGLKDGHAQVLVDALLANCLVADLGGLVNSPVIGIGSNILAASRSVRKRRKILGLVSLGALGQINSRHGSGDSRRTIGVQEVNGTLNRGTLLELLAAMTSALHDIALGMNTSVVKAILEHLGGNRRHERVRSAMEHEERNRVRVDVAEGTRGGNLVVHRRIKYAGLRRASTRAIEQKRLGGGGRLMAVLQFLSQTRRR